LELRGDPASRARGYWALLQTARKKAESANESEQVTADDYEPDQPE
jgi:hypothetical protein